MLKIVTDGAVDMPQDWFQKYRINLIPLMVRFGEEVFTQGVNIDVNNFYDLVRQKNIIPKSSLPSPAPGRGILPEYRFQTRHVLSIHVASKMSGTFNVIQIAANRIIGRAGYPSIRFRGWFGSNGLHVPGSAQAGTSRKID